ncbi:ketoacyl-synt-domain-containing protein [Sporormia fimetaria CBS 119925]|uniref:Ketoacyl-synt-domain-containing protein n=1 Tax=Sporormia fimetaria CBS 119925 TaxID=1340428 RepID=A0A6A6VFE5_9PLEO|nr:ketoacyl-synt-domain-containing protein [Sporormia fimetaria CBS 119925]
MEAPRPQDVEGPEPIAVLGMACRLPGNISKPSDFWKLLEEKRTGYKEFDSSRFNIDGFYHPNPARPGSINTRGGHLLDCDPHLFDHTFFPMHPSEVLTMDPMQRKIVEVSYEAMESAGEPWEKFSGSNTGVFIGNFCTDYYLRQMSDLDFAPQYTPTGANASILSNRVNHLLNLKGPSMTIDTACASSMYALHLAVNALRVGDCDAAIVGGTNIILSPEAQQLTGLLGALSGTSLCHTFDEAADGYSRAEGFCALYLRRYSDAVEGENPIRAVIRGTAVNSNGKTAGISHPGADGQEALIRKAYKNAGLPTHLTGYFECHGTGTPVGDPIEVSAIAKVFSEGRKTEPLLIGSVKTNLGHSEAASGITGVIKSILALEKGMIPATVGIKRLNPNIDFDGSHVKVVTEMTPWPKGLLRRVSVNSFGFGGANGHCILDHPDLMTPKLYQNGDTTGLTRSRRGDASRRLSLLVFSAHDQAALKANLSALQDAIPSLPLLDVAYTLSERRSRFVHKTFAVVEVDAPSQGLSVPAPTTKTAATQLARIGFIFTGQGAQWPGMGRDLFEYAVFSASIAAQDAVLASLPIAPSWTLAGLLKSGSESVKEPQVSQTVCTALQVALVDLLRSWNIGPQATVGHSSGEIAATYAAGRISLEEAIVTAYCRGRSIAANKRKGAMLAVGLGMEETVDLLQSRDSPVSIAAINSPNSVTLSGDEDAIGELYQALSAEGVFVRLLQTGGNAYHSDHMMALGESYETMLADCLAKSSTRTKSPSECAWVSSVTPHKQAEISPRYWRQNLESPVRYSTAVQKLLTNPQTQVDILIEIGPHAALRSALKQISAKAEKDHGVKAPTYLSALRRSEDGMKNLLSLCGSLFQLNHGVDIAAVNSVDVGGPRGSRRVHGKVCPDMPTYQYTYGPVIFYENRAARELRNRRTLHHDLLGVLKAGGAQDHPMWRNMVRLKDVPWLRDHQLLPNAVMPAAAYVCLGIEAASQFAGAREGIPDSPVFHLRNVSIKNALRIPDDDLGIEMVTNLHISSFSQNWFQFTVASVDSDGNWTEHASGLVCIETSSPAHRPRLDNKMDPRHVDVREWYKRFTELGLGYGESFQGLSELRTDPYQGLASAKLALNTTEGMFTGLESKYVMHPASLDACFQLALIAIYGGQTGRAKHGFVPVSIDEMTLWPAAREEPSAQAIALGRPVGLRGAHCGIQVFDQSGAPRLNLNKISCVSYYGGAGKHSESDVNEYVRLAWKPDASTLGNCPDFVALVKTSENRWGNPFATFLDLEGHRNPNMQLLHVGAGTGEVSDVILQTLGGDTIAKRYQSYTLMDSSRDAVAYLKSELHKFKHVNFAQSDIRDMSTVEQISEKYDFVVLADSTKHRRDFLTALRNIRKLMYTGGRLVVLDTTVPDDEWQRTLVSAGFSGVDLSFRGHGDLPCSSVVATAIEPAKDSKATSGERRQPVYVIYQGEVLPLHGDLAHELRGTGIVPVIASLDSADKVPIGSRLIVTIDLGTEGLSRISKAAYQNVQILTQKASSLVWITKGGIIDGHEPEAAIAAGLLRILSTEKPESTFGVFHLDLKNSTHGKDAARFVVDHERRLEGGDAEAEVALHDGVLYIPRLVYDFDLVSRYQRINASSLTTEEMPLHGQGPVEVDFATPGLLSSAYFKQIESFDAPLPADHVEIKTSAIGLSPTDVAVASGRSDKDIFSQECAGTVVACGSTVQHLQPGDRVYALASSKLANRIRVQAGLVQRMGSEDTFESACTVPVAFCTAVYGLLHLARLKKGDKVLIQSATESLGLAALQIAASCEAEIFAGVSRKEDAEYLCDYLSVAHDHIIQLPSQSEASIDALMAASGNRGFNVILGSSSGEMMQAVWRCLAPRGHFVDVGRLEVQKRSTLAMEVCERNASFSSFDLGTMVKQDPEFVSQLMQQVDEMWRSGIIQPIDTISVFDVAYVDAALSSAAHGNGFVKVVVSYGNDSTIKVAVSARATFDPDAEYIIVGGLGGLGRSIIRWMITRGARHFTVFSRSTSPAEEARPMLKEVEASGATVMLKRVDITSQEQVNETISYLSRERPIKGILNAAAGFDSGVFEKMPYEAWENGLAAKVRGTVNLHAASLAYGLPLDFFVMTSSLHVVIGAPAQAAYCAGNAFQDAFARYRRSLGLPAFSTALGLIAEITKVGESQALRSLIHRNQMYAHGELEFLRLLEAAFLETPSLGENNGTWRDFDGLATAQVLAYGDPRRLAAEFRDNQEPKWRQDKKFAHIVRAMKDCLDTIDEPTQPKGEDAVTEKLDRHIRAAQKQAAAQLVTREMIKCMASLLSMEAEAIDPSRSVAHYGVDSLIAVELRSWILGTFDSKMPLLKLLDERLSIAVLADGIVADRAEQLGLPFVE